MQSHLHQRHGQIDPYLIAVLGIDDDPQDHILDGLALLLGQQGGFRLALVAQELIGGDIEQPGQLRQQGDIGAGEIIFPFADRLRRDAEFGGEFFLCHILFAAQLRDAAAESLIHHNNVTSKCCVMFGVGAPFHD